MPICEICHLQRAVTKCVGCGQWLCASCMEGHLSDISFPPYQFIRLNRDERTRFYPSW